MFLIVFITAYISLRIGDADQIAFLIVFVTEGIAVRQRNVRDAVRVIHCDIKYPACGRLCLEKLIILVVPVPGSASLHILPVLEKS